MQRNRMNENALQIGIFGTFDVKNYGDLLFPLIAETELAQRLGAINLHRFSYTSKTLPDWPYPVTSLLELPAKVNGLDGILVGGGDIIRFDKEIAPSYEPPNDTIHHPTGYWLLPMLLALKLNIPLAWNAPGVWKAIPSGAEPLMKLIIEGSDYVAVRDEASMQRLRPFANEAKVHIVPDTAWGLATLRDIKVPTPAFRELCTTYKLNKPYIIIQANEKLRDVACYIGAHPHLFQDYQLVVLPIGAIFGENSHMFTEIGLDAIRLPNDIKPLLTAEIIKHASAVVAVSLHLSISTLASGGTLFRPDSAFNDKYGTLSKFQNVFAFRRPDDIHPRLFVKHAERANLSTDLQEVLAKLSQHWDNVAAAFLNPRDPVSRQQALNDFQSAMPHFMEGDWLSRYASTMNEFSIEETPQQLNNTFYKRVMNRTKVPLRAVKRWFIGNRI
jgi:hypothetical protein